MRLWKITLIDSFSCSEVYVEAPGIKEAVNKLGERFKEDQIKSIELVSSQPILR